MNMSSEKRLQFAMLRGIYSQRAAFPRQQIICFSMLPSVGAAESMDQLLLKYRFYGRGAPLCSFFSTCLCTIKPQQDGQH
jgi:hypothetical protein